MSTNYLTEDELGAVVDLLQYLNKHFKPQVSTIDLTIEIGDSNGEIAGKIEMATMGDYVLMTVPDA